ncbi:MAG: hypothetical protein IBJ16_03275, partial [Chitinophagaceae bacterium]|nr:hypothetical protein [Chitinophagaceae bacterium]
TGSGTGSGIYSYGLAGINTLALGSLASGTGVYAFGVVFENLTGSILNKINIQYKATQWRKGGSGNTNHWQFSYQTRHFNNIDTGNLIKKNDGNLISIHHSSGTATLNGHLSTNQYTIHITITDIIWRPGEKLILRWDDQDETGSDDGMAIDDFHFSAIRESYAPAIRKPIIDSIGTNTVKMMTIINDHLSHTQVRFEYDTLAEMSLPITITNIAPTHIPAGSGNTVVSGQLNGLRPGKKYYARGIANNLIGTTISDTIEFTTITTTPDILTDTIFRSDFHALTASGKLISDNGSAIVETGFCWAINDTPKINNNRLPVTMIDSIWSITIRDLPLNISILIRPYAQNEKGISYGIPFNFRTPVSIQSFTSALIHSNKDTLLYELLLRKPVDSITTQHFTVQSIPENGASITGLERKNDSTYILKMYSGHSDATLQPVLHRNAKQSPPIHPSLFKGTKTVFDKTPPEIVKVIIPDRSYKLKDTIPVTIFTKPDHSSFKLLEGNLSGYPISEWHKQNDSVYQAICIISPGGYEIDATAAHRIALQIQDSANNINPVSTFMIIQNNDAIDLTRPLVKSLILPERKKFKAGDTLSFVLAFNEKIQCDTIKGKPVLSVTIGTRIRNPAFNSSTATSIQFNYVIQPDEFDADGIRLANTINLNNSIIQDQAGNLLLNNIPSAGIITDIFIDAVLPEIIGVNTPAAKLYGLNDTLRFQVFFSKPVQLSTLTFPFLETVIGNTTYKISYSHGSPSNRFIFQLPIQKGMLDKNGISLSNQIFLSDSIIDDIGNPIKPLLKNIGALSSIHIDAIMPLWMDSTITMIPVCKKGEIFLDKLLQVYDEEKSGGLQWNIIESPIHGFINGFPFSSKLTTNIHEPKNLVYRNTDDTVFKDSCRIEVTDGVNRIHKQIIFEFFPAISNNNLSKNQIICAGTIPEVIKGEIPSGGNETYTYYWQRSTQITQPIFQTVPSNNHPSLQPGNLQHTTLFRRIVQSAGCTDTSQNILIEVKTKGLWLGKQNNSWHTGSNWCGAVVPDHQTDVIIQTSHQPVFITDSAFCRSLQLLEKSRLILSGILSYEHTIIGQYAIRSVNGTLVAMGKNLQYLPTQSFENNQLDHLIVKGNELVLSDSLYLNQSLQLIKGKFHTQDLLVLNSNAIILPNAAGTQLIGKIKKKFTLQNNWITHPFKENILALNSSSQYTPSTKSYAIFNNLENDKFEPYSLMVQNYFRSKKLVDWRILEQENNLSQYLWNRSSGISLFKPFDKKVRTTIQLFGHPIIGDEEMIFPTVQDTQYYLTGNPYIAPILSKNISRSHHIGHYFWVWDSSLAGTGGFSAKAFDANAVIEPLHGFIIKTNPGRDASIRFSEQAKLTVPLPDSINGIIENRYQISLTLYQDRVLLDKFLLIDIDTASIRFDEDDAEKLFNQYYNLYSLSFDQIPLSIDARNITPQTYIPLGIQTKTQGSYTIQFDRVWLPSRITLELHDLFTGNITKVKQDSIVHFQITTDTSSYGEKRFVLRAPIPPAPQEEPIILKLAPIPAQHHLNVYFKSYQPGHSFVLIKNIYGQILRKQVLGQHQEGNFLVSLNGLLNGAYILEMHCGNRFVANTFIKL